MRLLNEEYQEISKMMNDFGLPFELVKRKGWIHIEVNGKLFAFHRKKKSDLREGKFTDSIHYFIRREGKSEQKVADFQKVMDMLNEWLEGQF